MKYSYIVILLALVFICLQSFSQKSKPNIKPDPTKIQSITKDPEPKAYCSSTYTNQTDDSITYVRFNSIRNYSGQEGPTSYGDYTSQVTGLLAGSTYNLSVTFSSQWDEYVWAWFDWNKDDDFYDAGESFYLDHGTSNTFLTSITVPSGATVGDTRMRIIEQYSNNPGPCDPHYTNYPPSINIYGETEDYTVYVNSNSYCQASGGGDEYIWIVDFPDHGYTNSSGSNGYMDYAWLWSIPIPINTSAYMTITVENPWDQDQCGIWVDWNRDNDFAAIEAAIVNGTPSTGHFNAVLSPPPGATLGECIVRIRLQYSQDPLDPCGLTDWGEVEDYRINLTPAVPCTWTGAVDNNWHNPDNWNTTDIPGATDDVIIPNVTNKCWVWAANAECKNLTLEAGTYHDLRIYEYELSVNGNMTIHGQLTMDVPGGTLNVDGNIYWEAGSSAYISGYNLIILYGDWIFKSGSNVHLDDGEVRFSGSGTYLRNFSSNSYFNDVVVYKASSEWLSISSNTTHDIRINGNLQITAGGTMYIYSPHSILLGGNLHSSGYLYCYDGDFCFDGNTQNISVQLGYTTIFQFHNLRISSMGSTTILNKDIIINNNLTIESGQFIPNNHTVTISGDWTNQVGPSAFVEGNGKVIFTGSSSNIFGNEDFNTIEVNKSSGYYYLGVEYNTVTCQHYDWTNGEIYASDGGTFTAYDLVDNGIYGGWTLQGGTINISNYGSGKYVDLNGEITIYYGFMNVYGEVTLPSYWPFAADAEINMSGGILDFHNQGIYIYNSPTYTLTENITGGVIRTAGGFWGESSNFSPDYGITEFYGSTYATIYTINGCNLNSITIDKSSKGDNTSKQYSTTYTYPLVDERSGKLITDGSKSNTIEMTGFVDVNGEVSINNGILNTNGNSLQVRDHWKNYVGDAGFVESTGTVFFDENFHSWLYTDETFYNLILNKPSYNNSLNTDINVEIDVLNDLSIDDGIFNLTQNTKLRIDGNLFIAFEACLNPDSGSEIEIGENWTNENYNNTQSTGYWKGGEIVTFNGGGDQILNTNVSEETFGNIIINKAGGYFRPNDNIHVDGALQIQDGDWWDNITGLSHWFTGHVLIEANGGYYPLGTTTFKGLNFQTYENNGGQAVFGDIIIDKHYSKNGEKDLASKNGQKDIKAGTLALNSIMVVYNYNTTTIEEGTFDLNGNSFKSLGDIYINDGGILDVDAGALLSIGSGLYVHNGGQFISLGESGNNATVWKDVIGYYDFQVYSGGTISANYTYFQDMNENGIWVQDGAFVDPSHPFSNCNFIDGINTSPSLRLVIDNDQTLNINNIVFENNPYISGAYNIGKTWPHGELYLSNYSGDFAGPDFEYDGDDRIHWIANEIELELKVFMEGPFNDATNEMNVNIHGEIPNDQPYYLNPLADWYYTGGEYALPIPDFVVDWVIVDLRDATSAAAATTSIARQAAFVLNTGELIDMYGSNLLTFNTSVNNNLYVAVMHRNHAGVMSAVPLVESGGIYSYDFSSGGGQVHGGSSAHKQLSTSPEIWGMMSGDADGDGEIEFQDINNIWSVQAGNTGYLESDFNLDTQSNNKDKNDYWVPNLGEGSFIPE